MSIEAVNKHVTATENSPRPLLHSNELSFPDRQKLFQFDFSAPRQIHLHCQLQNRNRRDVTENSFIQLDFSVRC
jgi:hypothetical protein